MLGDEVDGAFARGGQVAQGVLCVCEAAGEADSEERGVVVDDLGVGVRGEVCGGAWDVLVISNCVKRRV